MDGSLTGYLIGILICIVCSAFFSASETAYTTLNRIRMKTEEEAGNSRAALALRISENFDTFLSTVLVGNNVVNIASTAMATVMFTILFANNGASISTVVMTVVVLIFGEITPKSLAKEYPESFAKAVAPIFRVLMLILTPVNFLMKQWKKLLRRLFKGESKSKMTSEELRNIVDEAHNEGGIDEDNVELLRSALDFDDQEARDILTPRVDLVGIDVETPFEEIADVFLENTYSRLLVYKETIDNIIGMVHEKDYFCALHEGQKELEPIITKVIYVSSSIQIFDLLRVLQQRKLHMAVVVDEFGGTEGIVTMEDIIEELVGEIWDEHDEVKHYIQKVDNGRYKVDCGANLEDLFEFLHLSVDEDAFDSVTVNGWVSEQLERVPTVGDTFEFEGLRVTVTGATAHHAVEILVQLPDERKEEPSKKDTAK